MCSSNGRKGHLLGQLDVRQEIACQSQTPRDAFYCSFPWVAFQKTFDPFLPGQKVSSIYIYIVPSEIWSDSFNAGLTLVGYKLSVKYKISGNVCCPLKTN